ncbi:uncharacterized protein LOC132201311 [Neocloeon triangulifer]|uniref:uncharacterized protein LOC132201311 n=1 Tax=Neocloeon triangulifer TaxID=2078957 RepID=UPI00286F2D75|nr:uncharacterized protein LOC132201311 [Neocloeon triangulifer]
MVMSSTLEELMKKGSDEDYPKGPAKLGHFRCLEKKENNADNAFVLVVHYEFKKGKKEKPPRDGNKKDIENLRKTFAETRNCAFRECSPKKDDLLALLKDGEKLKRFFGASEVLEPDVFILIVLSHGAANGVIYTDPFCSSDPKDYETFTTDELFKSIKEIFPKCLKSVFLGPCRGQLKDSVYNPSEADKKLDQQKNDFSNNNQNSTRVSFEPKMRNLVIFYATVETTMSNRSKSTGTWFVKALCQELDGMQQNEGLAKILTGVQNRIHQETDCSFDSIGQTPEFKIFCRDRKFFFHAVKSKDADSTSTDATGKKGSPVVEKPRSIHFDWINPRTNKVLRGRRALIFHQGEEINFITNLNSVLTENLGFETSIVKIDAQSLEYYLKGQAKSWADYGCFAAFFFAEIVEDKEGQVCINLNEKVPTPIGKLIHGLLGPKNGDWIGKPKLFFLVDKKSTASDGTITDKKINLDDFLRATNHCGWLVFFLQSKSFLSKFFEIVESQEIKRESSSLQELLFDVLITFGSDETNEPEAMMVSTLPHLLNFPELRRYFIQPEFLEFLEESRLRKKWDALLESKQIREKHRIWVLSSLPGSGKSTVMRELAFEMQRKFKGEMKVFQVVLLGIYGLFDAAEKKRKDPSLAEIVSHATGNRDIEIQDLIDKKKLMLMFDGFDEICPHYREQVLKLFAEAAEKNLPFWISTRPHEEDTIRTKLTLRNGKEICYIEILPLDWSKQIDFFMIISKKSKEQCKHHIKFYKESGSEDILGNPLHLKMIANLTVSDSNKVLNLYEIYEKIIDEKLKSACSSKKDTPECSKELKDSWKKIKDCGLDILLTGNTTGNWEKTISGIMTISNGRAQFVHQTFAEFLVAAHFIDRLFDGLKRPQRPFNILKEEFLQVRKFVDLRISMSVGDEKLNLLTSLEKYLKKKLTKSSIKNVILEERLVNFSSAAANLVTFNAEESNELNYVTSDQILVLASERVENFALGLMNNDAYKKLVDPNTAAVKMLTSAIENNFVQLFAKLGENCANLMDLVWNNQAISSTVIVAASKNYQETLSLVLEKGILDPSDANTIQEALKSAVRNNSVDCVKLMIAHGARTADLDDDDFEYLSNNTTKALLKTKHEPELKLASRIFNGSLKCKNVEVANFIFEKFGDAEYADFEVNSNALIAVTGWNDHNAAEILGRLLVEKRGLQVCITDDDGWNAFHWAAKEGNVGLVKYFLEKDSALTKTLTVRKENAMHLLLSYGLANTGRKIEICKYFLDLDSAMMTQKTAKNKTMLHSAALGGSLGVCKWLLQVKGLKIDNAVDDDGWNAMHFAASSKFRVKLKLLEYLHEKNPQLIRMSTNRNETALHIVATNWNGRVETFNWFVRKGVDESVRDLNENTALEVAHKYFLEEYKEFLGIEGIE